MKVLTWNANMAFRKKWERVVLNFDPDVLIVQESEHPDKFDDIPFPYFHWTGDNQNKGLAIFSKYKIQVLESRCPKSRYHIPCFIEGISIIAIWAMQDNTDRMNRYIGGVFRLLEEYQDLMDSPFILAGDFNWNLSFDKDADSPLYGNFNDVKNFLSEKKINSAYHQQMNEEFGEENSPTLFFQKKKEKPFHIDYMFMGEGLKVKNFTVGQCDSWIDISDHMLLFSEVVIEEILV